MAAPDYAWVKIEGGRLTVLREMPFDARELETACRRLLTSNEPGLVVDLTRVSYVASTQVGALIGASARAAESGRTLRILVSPGLQRFLERAQLEGILDYEVVK
jgi:anti-anti-sigma regulatory factor